MISCGKAQKVRFNDIDYVLIEGALTTPEKFQNGQVSFALVGADNIIRRYGTVIGDISDIEFLGEEIDIDMSVDGLLNMLTGEGGWF